MVIAGHLPSILWLRRDLRRADHPALSAAAQDGPVLPLFIVEPRLWRAAGPVRRGWIAANVLAARDAFEGRLCLRIGRPETVLRALCAEHDVAAVHHTRETTPWAVRRDDRVAATLGERGIDMVATGTPYAVGPGLVTRETGAPYKMFTPFSRAWRSHGWPAPAPDLHGLQLAAAADDPEALSALEEAVHQCPVPLPDAGENAARHQWEQFLQTSLDRYDEDRDRPDRDGTSRLSPYLKVGAIHPRTLLHDLGTRRSRSADRFRTELAWREFYADVLWRAPESAWHDMTSGMSALYDGHGEGSGDEDVDELVRVWQEGRTGYPLVDAGMRQLHATGWMHNRVRMVTASFFTKDLHRWWAEGARYFMEHLIDGDLASNNHGWQWVAGTGTDAAPFHRVFNPVRQAERFDPDGDYVREWVPELRHLTGAAVHAPWKHPEGHAHGYPGPVVEHDSERRDALERYEHVRAARTHHDKEHLMQATSSSSQANTTALPAGRFLVLDEEFVASLNPRQLQKYLDVLTRAASGTHADVGALAQVLADEFDRLDMPMPPVQVKMIAEQLFGVQDARLDIATTGGVLLAQKDGVVGVPERRGSAADPEHPSRPLIS